MNRRSLILLIFWLSLVIFIFIVAMFKFNKWNGRDDFRMGIFTDEKVAMLNISPERKMVNFLEISGDTELWIPGGLGWYKTEKIKNILEQEKIKDQADEILFYNFGFLADKISWGDDINFWKNDWNLIGNLGIIGWIKYRVGVNNWLFKDEVYDGEIQKDGAKIREMIFRDFADNKIVNGESKITIVNTTSHNGFGTFMANLSEYSGFSVISIDTISKEIERCQFIFGTSLSNSYEFELINKIWNCENILDENLDEWNGELYFGENEVLMLKYSNYGRS